MCEIFLIANRPQRTVRGEETHRVTVAATIRVAAVIAGVVHSEVGLQPSHRGRELALLTKERQPIASPSLPLSEWQQSSLASSSEVRLQPSALQWDAELLPHSASPASTKRIMALCCDDHNVYVVRADSKDIEIYSAGEWTGSIAMPSAGWLSGIAVSAVHNCLYAGGHQSTQLHRVGLASASNTVWYVP